MISLSLALFSRKMGFYSLTFLKCFWISERQEKPRGGWVSPWGRQHTFLFLCCFAGHECHEGSQQKLPAILGDFGGRRDSREGSSSFLSRLNSEENKQAYVSQHGLATQRIWASFSPAPKTTHAPGTNTEKLQRKSLTREVNNHSPA